VYDAQYHLQREFNSPWNPSINDVPNLFEWDLINHAGKIVKEQFHVYHLTERNTNFSEIRLFEVDLTPPYANIEVKPISFSPEVDQQLTIKTNLDPNAKWTMKIKDHKQEIIFSKDLSPRDRQVVWNGKTSRGKALDDGQYFLEIDGLDAAENLYAYRKNIYIDRNQYRVDVKSSEAIFSPNGDGYLDYVKFTTSITNSNRIQIAKWFFEIKQNHETVKSWEGFGSVPEIIWDGKNQRNQKLQDGQYQFIMKITLVTEVELKSVLQTIAIDTSPPQIVINFEGNFDDFTPDASGLNDTLQIKNQIHDQSPIINWKVNIYQEEFLLQTLSGLNQPKDTIIWDGRTNLRELESFEEYSLELIATDAMNLTGYSKRIKFETGAILIHSERGDLIRISNILFETNSAELMGEKTFRVIKKLAKALLQKYQNIPISIEGHTDSEGEDRNFDNRGLSERRALSVKNAIQLEGVRQPIEHFGHGFQYPLFQPERNAYEKQMNRRVDFLLKKKERQIVKPKVKVIRGKSR
jgi:outer membrane protein OmpA-like peptidoglycan-associated protein/flagellar hook assembly protein FlgD